MLSAALTNRRFVQAARVLSFAEQAPRPELSMRRLFNRRLNTPELSMRRLLNRRLNTPELSMRRLFNRSLARPKGEQPFTKATLLYRPVEHSGAEQAPRLVQGLSKRTREHPVQSFSSLSNRRASSRCSAKLSTGWPCSVEY